MDPGNVTRVNNITVMDPTKGYDKTPSKCFNVLKAVIISPPFKCISVELLSACVTDISGIIYTVVTMILYTTRASLDSGVACCTTTVDFSSRTWDALKQLDCQTPIFQL
jgi:hypothetical protein